MHLRKVCSQCNTVVHVKKLVCDCGLAFALKKRKARCIAVENAMKRRKALLSEEELLVTKERDRVRSAGKRASETREQEQNRPHLACATSVLFIIIAAEADLRYFGSSVDRKRLFRLFRTTQHCIFMFPPCTFMPGLHNLANNVAVLNHEKWVED